MPLAKKVTRRWFHFDNHWSVAHCSDPNFSTILGGQPPWVTGITTQMGPKYKAVSPALLPILLREKGYYTCAIQPVKVPKFYCTFEDIAWQPTESVADLNLGAARAMTEAAGDRPFFLFIRDMTAHYPYFNRPMPPRGKGGLIVPLYQQAVEHIDRHVRRLVGFIKSTYPNTVIIIAADHGELLGEHGEWDHLYTLYNYLVRVPLSIYVPGLKKGKRTDRLTQHTDLWPTILDLVSSDSEAVESEHGISLAGWLRDKEKLLASRRLWLQGIGAGPTEVDDEHPRIDAEAGRVLWRHRAVVQDRTKIVENIHADGKREMITYPANDYAERKTRKTPVKTKASLPPVPKYHEWTKRFLADRNRKHDKIILERLKALGYA